MRCELLEDAPFVFVGGARGEGFGVGEETDGFADDGGRVR